MQTNIKIDNKSILIAFIYFFGNRTLGSLTSCVLSKKKCWDR
jgi:hypothetical protein